MGSKATIDMGDAVGDDCARDGAAVGTGGMVDCGDFSVSSGGTVGLGVIWRTMVAS